MLASLYGRKQREHEKGERGARTTQSHSDHRRGIVTPNNSCFYKVYNKLGYGRLEAVYRAALVHELRKLGLKVRTEVPLDVWYDGIIIATYRADVMVEDRVILELKAGPKLDPSWHGQLLNNLRTCDLELGILLFFGPRPYFKRLVWATNEGRKKDDS